jgi:tetratricopeptide (TPR) repeat protein
MKDCAPSVVKLAKVFMNARALQQAELALRAGRAADAKSLLLDALAACPGDPNLLKGLVAASATLGEVDGTIGYFCQLVEHAPRPLAVLDEFGRYCLAHGRVDAVVDAYQRYLASHPDAALAHFNCAWYATRLGRHELAVEHYRKALALGIERPEEVHLNIANLCSGGLRDDARAREHLERALAINERYAAAWFNLGNLEEQQGRRDEARRCFGRCLEVEPGNDVALARVAETHDFKDGAESGLYGRLTEAARRSRDADLNFALGRACEQRGEYAAAWRHYTVANEQDRRAFPRYDPAEWERKVDRIITTCTPEWLARLRQDQPRAPVFICGMFRSGSTLVEQVLAAHPAFTPAGEREFFPRLVAAALPGYPDGLESVDEKQLRIWSRAYAAESERVFGRAARLTDKRPDNFLYLGLIKAMFPRARIVVTQRDWRDVAVSVFATRLGPSAAYSTDLGHIRHYIGLHDQLIAHWRRLFGDDLVTVQYEALIAEPRATIESLLTELGESWDERCLAFHDLRNTVQTASVWQVRKPLYSSSVGRWRHFSDEFVAAFGTD